MSNLFLYLKYLIKRIFLSESNLTKDIIFLLNKINPKDPVIFDVGAYHGLWISTYIKKFEGAISYLFEPCKSSFSILNEKYKANQNINIFNIAMSNQLGSKLVNINTKEYTNSLLDLDEKASDSWQNEELKNSSKELVEVLSLDQFCINKNITKINLLKLDVQGYESRVLSGSKSLLQKGKVDLILLEIIVVPTYDKQSKVNELFNIFEENGFQLYGIYDIEKNPKRGKIQQFDALFYNENLDL
tara:strand:+ start:113 stop:844 length:732 start_codon:yes stop_codon:yes gene_type:complete